MANVDTARLWGSQSATALEHYLNTGDDSDGPPPEWQVGHFVALYGTLTGERGTLVAVADTYPSLGDNGRLLQPASRVAAALARDRPGTGGVLVVVASHSVSEAEQAIQRAGLQTVWWFN
ncbi:DUF6885 family protein [Actinoplanes lobatus]|uniref:DUF6885 family protein n=1 Tax=Actinoplanes lobatus TaxID=113568 RepID=UPI0038993DFA